VAEDDGGVVVMNVIGSLDCQLTIVNFQL
jgi:hypothetical protein